MHPGSWDSLPPSCQALGQLHFEGNIIPHTWYAALRLESGAVDLVAITLLAEICYFYRPTMVLDEHTGAVRGYTAKFKGDLLQRSHDALAAKFGLTKRQVQDALARLERRHGCIIRHYRTITTAEGVPCANVLFLEPVPEALARITTGRRQPSPGTTGGVSRYNVIPPPVERETYSGDLEDRVTEESQIPPVAPPPGTPPVSGKARSTPAALQVLEHLNALTGCRYTSTQQVQVVLTQGATVAQCCLVLDWLHVVRRARDPEWCEQYLNNVTPFRPANFDKYRAPAEQWAAAGRPVPGQAPRLLSDAPAIKAARDHLKAIIRGECA